MGKDLKGKELGIGLDQRKDGKYRARVTNAVGKRKTEYFDKLREAKKWIVEIQSYTVEDLRNDITVDEFSEIWLNLKRNSVKILTYNNYVRDYNNHIKPSLGKIPISKVRSSDIQNLLTKLGNKGYKKSSLSQLKREIHNLFALALDYEYIYSNPCRASISVNVGADSKPKDSFNKFEYKLFLKYTKGSKFEQEFRFLLLTGLRFGELIGLMWEDVDFGNGMIYIRHNFTYDIPNKKWNLGTPKTIDGIRKIPITSDIKQVLVQQKKKRCGKYVFTKDKPIGSNRYNEELERICKKANIKRVSLHQLRHTFATLCIENGMNPKILQSLLGHANIGVTMDMYVHVNDDALVDEMTKTAERMCV